MNVVDGVRAAEVKEDDEGGSPADDVGHCTLVSLLTAAVPEVYIDPSVAEFEGKMLKVDPYCP